MRGLRPLLTRLVVAPDGSSAFVTGSQTGDYGLEGGFVTVAYEVDATGGDGATPT